METLVILLVAAGIAAGVVWWVSSPREVTARHRPRTITFRETFQTTMPEPAAGIADDGFALDSAVPEEPPRRFMALIRIALTIAVVAVVAVGAIGGLWLLVKMQLDKYLLH